jgi:CRP/FNR family transcriptional regulator, cyclic AMP receptor protein
MCRRACEATEGFSAGSCWFANLVTSGMFSGVGSERVAVLVVDPELAERLDASRRGHAERLSVARVLRREVGVWDAGQDAGHGREGLGLLVVGGVLVRRVGLEGRYGAELLSVGDLLQPAAHDGEEAVLPFEATWRVLSPLRLAVLDLAWMTRMAAFPQVMAEITRRVMVRSRRLASMLAIAQHHRLDDRLRLFFWELADRYGRVGPEGVLLELTLTHELIGHLVGAHRPSISAALARLEGSGQIARRGRRWVLLGEPPSLAALSGEHPRPVASSSG